MDEADDTMLLLSGLLVAADIDWAALNTRVGPSVAHLARLDMLGREVGNGTGFVVGAPCQIATNHHVVSGSGSLVARFPGGQSFPITGVLADDPIQDLAIVVADGVCPPPLRLANDGVMPVGTSVAVIGSPLGFDGSVSVGTIAAERDTLEGSPGQWLQITAPISPGSSGSPVFLPDGQIAGVVTMVFIRGQNLNFASPVRHLRALLDGLQPGTPPRPLSTSTELLTVAQTLGFILVIVAGWAFAASRPGRARR